MASDDDNKNIVSMVEEFFDEDDDIRKALEENDHDLQKLSNEQLEEFAKKVSYYNNYIPAEPKWALVSVNNWEEDFMRKMTMTSLTSWLYRILDEWNPNGENTEVSLEKREIARQFLDRHFQYNPDKHLRSHHKKKYVKKEGMLVWDEEYVKNNGDNIDPNNPISLHEHTPEQVKEALDNPNLKYASEKNVPTDAFYHWARFTEVNYEPLITATSELFDVRPDMKWSIGFWDSFDSLEDANKCRLKWADNVKVPLNVIENNGHTLMGPWKNNVEATDYHNKNTELLKRMQDQSQSDNKLGEDIMRKKVRINKEKNIMQQGPDAPGLAAYTKAMNKIETLGAKPALTKEEKKDLEEAYRTRDDEVTPEDAVGVDVFRVSADPETGKQSMARKRIYSKADTPDDVLEQNRLRQAHFEGKMVKDRKGNMVPITDVIKATSKNTTPTKAKDNI